VLVNKKFVDEVVAMSLLVVIVVQYVGFIKFNVLLIFYVTNFNNTRYLFMLII